MAYSIRLLPDDRSCTAEEPTDLVMAAAACDILLEHPCGNRGGCGKCRVRVVEGRVAAGPEDVRLLGEEAVAEGWRLSCRMTLESAATIELQPAVRSAGGKSFGDDALFGDPIDPPIRSIPVRVPPADELEPASGSLPHHPPPGALERLALGLRGSVGRPGSRGNGALPGPDVSLRSLAPSAAALRALSASLRQGAQVRAWLDEDGRLLTVEPGCRAPEARGCGVAIDVGTTTLAVALVDLTTGDVLSSASGLNPQVAYGADVVARIAYAQDHDGQGGTEGIEVLRAAVVRGLNDLLERCVETAEVPRERIRSACAVGNPTMLHTLLGADPTPLGQAPYVGVWRGTWRGSAQELGLTLPSYAACYLVPGIGSHVGADTVAGIVATGLDRAAQPTLLIDLGTNSEVVLGCRDFIVVASTSAGPAFEGAAIHHGMRGAPGAIEQVRIRSSGSVMVRAISSETPRGICGSGLVDAVAELLRVGILEPSGRMRPRPELEGQLPGQLLDRLSEHPAVGRAFRLAGTEDNPVLLTAADVRQLQLVKGSIAAGMQVLLRRKGLWNGDVADLLLAGAFGNYLRKASALAIGLVPDIDPERVRFVGNAAGAGARAALCDRGFRRRAEEVAALAEYVELADAPEYADTFADQMPFPAPVEVGQ